MYFSSRPYPLTGEAESARETVQAFLKSYPVGMWNHPPSVRRELDWQYVLGWLWQFPALARCTFCCGEEETDVTYPIGLLINANAPPSVIQEVSKMYPLALDAATEQEKLRQEAMLRRLNNQATTIQRHARGFWVRKRVNRKATKRIKDLEEELRVAREELANLRGQRDGANAEPPGLETQPSSPTDPSQAFVPLLLRLLAEETKPIDAIVQKVDIIARFVRQRLRWKRFRASVATLRAKEKLRRQHICDARMWGYSVPRCNAWLLEDGFNPLTADEVTPYSLIFNDPIFGYWVEPIDIEHIITEHRYVLGVYWDLNPPRVGYLNVSNLFSNEISVEDFREEHNTDRHPRYRNGSFLESMLQGQSIALPAEHFFDPPAEAPVYFPGDQRVDFTTDFKSLREAYYQLSRQLNDEFIDEMPTPLSHIFDSLWKDIRLIHYYAWVKYPIILRERKMVLAFLSTTNYQESASYALGQRELSGVLKHILGFAVSGENYGEECLVALDEFWCYV